MNSANWVRVRTGAVFSLAISFVALAQPAKRPITPADYDAWNSIQGQTLSRDGKFLAYLVGPVVGDREYVILNLANGKEWRHKTAGSAPEATAGEPGVEPTAPTPSPTPPIAPTGPRGPGGRFGGGGGPTRIAFTPDGKRVVFLLSPTRAESEAAEKAKKESPKNALCIQDLTSGALTRIAGVTSFELPAESSSYIAHRPERPVEKKDKSEKPAVPAPKPKPPLDDADDDQQPMPPTPPRTPTTAASDLTLRNLADNSERKITEVTAFGFTKDGKQLWYVVSSKIEETNGVYLTALEPKAAARPILSGKGRYTSATWDEKQTQLAFVVEKSDAAAGSRPKPAIFYWSRTPIDVAANTTGEDVPTRAVEIITAATPGLRAGWEIVDRGLAFSADSKCLYVSTAPVQKTAKEKEPPPASERPNLELWHWKDEMIVPMQKVRGTATANPTFRAVYHIQDRKLVQVTDEAMANINFAREGDWAYGSDDRPYRTLVGFDANYNDLYLVNLQSGQRVPVLRKKEGGFTWSPSGKFLLHHDGKHWISVAVPSLKSTNLTAKIPATFFREEHDTPSSATSHQMAGWTADDKYVLLYDRYDIWQVTADGTEFKNLTSGAGRKAGLQLRYLSLDPEARTIDLSKPLILRAENLDTRQQGFYRLQPDGKLEELHMAARNFGPPTKAKNADVCMLTTSSFYDAPETYITSANFNEFRKVSNTNPQKDKLLWGKAELLNFRSADGQPLSSILIKPENFDPAKKHPMIVYIYERLSQNLHNFVPPRAGTSINATYYASNGYLVLMPDIAYTIGYPGQSALKCVLPAIDAVVAQGCVNEKAIGIQGHSWGGYQTAYMITQTNRFKAAASGAPVVNMISAYDGIRWGTGLPRQFQYERTQSRIGGTLWQFPMRFVENSPIFMADRVSTPLMMLHNDRDGAVPWYQGIEYYLALRRLGKEVYLFNYVGEDHGLTRRVNQKDYTQRMKDFFDHHLKGAPQPEWMAKGMPYRPPPTAPATTPSTPTPRTGRGGPAR